MAKKSFLDKLTGGSKDSQEETFEKEFNEESEEETPVKTQNETSENDDLLSQEEGQLTLDVYQTPTEVVIKSTIAGVKPEDLDISINNDMVTIKGKREKVEEISVKDYYYQELYWGIFSRSVILPVEVDADEAQASMKNGILTIRLPKMEKEKRRKIKVKSE